MIVHARLKVLDGARHVLAVFGCFRPGFLFTSSIGCSAVQWQWPWQAEASCWRHQDVYRCQWAPKSFSKFCKSRHVTAHRTLFHQAMTAGHRERQRCWLVVWVVPWRGSAQHPRAAVVFHLQPVPVRPCALIILIAQVPHQKIVYTMVNHSHTVIQLWCW